MTDPTDPRAVADDPSGIVQQMPDGGEPAPRIWVEPTGYREGWTGIPDQVEPDDVEYIRADIARATEADLRAEVERLREENALMAASLDEEERKCGLSTNGGMWRFWARQLREYHARRAALTPEPDGGQ